MHLYSTELGNLKTVAFCSVASIYEHFHVCLHIMMAEQFWCPDNLNKFFCDILVNNDTSLNALIVVTILSPGMFA